MDPRRLLPAGVLALSLPALAVAQPSTTRVSVGSGGVQGDYGGVSSAISADGRWVVFQSGATNLVTGDTNEALDIFVHDRLTLATTRVSVTSNGAQAIGRDGSWMPAISADGRFVAFQSWAHNLVANDTNNHPDVFVHDRVTAATERVSVGTGGIQANHSSYGPSMSADGRFVAFSSAASNLVAGAAGTQVYIHDRQTGATILASVNVAGAPAEPGSGPPSLSADGRVVAFSSFAGNLVPGDTNGRPDVFVRDLQTGTTTRVSVGPGGVEADRGSTSAAISADGRWVAFDSDASNLVAGDTTGRVDVFLHDRLTATTSRVSVGPGGLQGNFHSFRPFVSGDGRFVSFRSEATNLVDGDTNALADAFVHDRLTGTTTRVSLGPGDVQANGASGHSWGIAFSMSGDGRFVAFESQAGNLVPADTNNEWDVFVRDRGDQGCTTVAPASASLPAAGGSGMVAVAAPAACAWASVSINPSWLTVTGGASGTGNGALSYSASANTGGPRIGAIAIGGAIFAVTQASGDPTPAAPLGLVAHLIAANQVTLRWTVPPTSFPPTNFVVEGGTLAGSVQASLQTGSATPTFIFQAPPGSYYARVHALNGALRGPASNEIRIHVLVPVPPSAPANLLGLVNGSTVGLAWSNTYTGGAPTSLVLDVTGPITTSLPLPLVEAFIHFGVPPGTYTLRLRAVNAAGSSPPSNPVILTFPTPCTGPPLAPSLFAYNVGRALFLSWAPADSGAAPTSYVLNVTGTFTGTLPIGGRFHNGIVVPGTYSFTVAATNPCGTSAPSATQTVIVR
jgi:Tol biopolymer transport system component